MKTATNPRYSLGVRTRRPLPHGWTEWAVAPSTNVQDPITARLLIAAPRTAMVLARGTHLCEYTLASGSPIGHRSAWALRLLFGRHLERKILAHSEYTSLGFRRMP